MFKISEKGNLPLTELLSTRSITNSLLKACTKLKLVYNDRKYQSECGSNLLGDCIGSLKGQKDKTTAELLSILKNCHFVGLMMVHDTLAKQVNQSKRCINKINWPENNGEDSFHDTLRIIGLSRKQDEVLGFTVSSLGDQITVSRIIHGSAIHKQGLLEVGDIICEINDKSIKGNLNVLQDCLKSSNSLTLKIKPSQKKLSCKGSVFMKTYFNYTPENDDLIPCGKLGLSFSRGQVLKVLDQSDRCWWQAQVVNNAGEPVGEPGLVPSKELQEHRCYTHAPTAPPSKPSRVMYKLSEYVKFDAFDIPLYEEVTWLPPFSRKVVILVSPTASTAHAVAHKLIESKPNIYQAPVVHCSSEALCSESNYTFLDRDVMAIGIKNNKYLEYTEKDNIVYGVKFDSLSEVVKSQKTCVKNVLAKNLKFLLTSEYMPYVIFILNDKLLQSDSPYIHLADLVVTFTTVQETAHNLLEHLDEIASQKQWIPVTWLY